MSDFSCYGGASKEWQAIEAVLPPQMQHQSATEHRDAINREREKITATEFQALANLVDTADYHIATRDGSGTIGARSYWPKTVLRNPRPAIFLYMHGGGYMYGSLATEDATAARIAVGAGVVVLSVNYRHTPEHPYPTAWLDCQDAFLWLHDRATDLGIDPRRVVVGGISAGGHLAASLVLEQHLGRLPGDNVAGHRLQRIAGQVLMVPALVHQYCYGVLQSRLASPAVSSRVENAEAPGISSITLRLFTDLLQVDRPDPSDIMLNPGLAHPSQVRGLPPAVFGICGFDPLRDEGLLYAKLLAEQGVSTDVHLFKGVPHSYRRYGNLALHQDWDDVLEQGIIWALSEPSPTGGFHVNVHEV